MLSSSYPTPVRASKKSPRLEWLPLHCDFASQGKIKVVSPIPRGKKAGWTDEENECLKFFVAQNLRVAAAFKRSTLSIRNQARKLGAPFPPMKEYRKKFGDAPSNRWPQ